MPSDKRPELKKKVRDVLHRAPVWVNPGHTSETAVVLLKGYRFGGLPVVDGTRLVGMIESESLLHGDEERLVSDLMQKDIPVITPDADADEAAKIMCESGVHRLPVLDNGKLIGVITCTDLLPEVTRSFDPLTHLPWSDWLREWAIDKLQSSREITVLFVDLDKFGRFNKRYGHLVGDEVLRAVTRALLEVTAAPLDYVSKFGGDEFCIGTMRSVYEATELAGLVKSAIEAVRIDGHGDEAISCTIGQAGGKRSHERLHVHYAATMNSLIDLASKNCMELKAAAQGEAEADEEPKPIRPRLTVAEVTRKGRRVTVNVEMQLAGKPLTPATIIAEADDEEVLTLVSQATADALKPALPNGYELVVSDVQRHETRAGQTYICVVGSYTGAAFTLTVAGAAVVTADLYRATAGATLDCVNRLLGR